MLEWYRTGIDYQDLMDECEELVKSVISERDSGPLFSGLAGRFSLDGPCERLTVGAAFDRYAKCSVEEALATDRYEKVLVEQVEPNLGVGQPTFLYDYPASLASLARLKKDEPTIAERFELYIDGIELANGFSELVDPVEQRQRFEKDRNLIFAAGRDPGPMPEKFLTALENIPEAAGIALGLDRLVMVLTGADSIDEVVTFGPEEL
jgi:lysyl-tRNA synthetase class 2